MLLSVSVTVRSLSKYPSSPIWGLIHEQKPYLGSLTWQIEKAEYYWNRVVNLPCSTSLTEEDVNRVVNCIKNYEKC